MDEQRIREIVREELSSWEKEKVAFLSVQQPSADDIAKSISSGIQKIIDDTPSVFR